jgi:hypothetical protein
VKVGEFASGKEQNVLGTCSRSFLVTSARMTSVSAHAAYIIQLDLQTANHCSRKAYLANHDQVSM